MPIIAKAARKGADMTETGISRLLEQAIDHHRAGRVLAALPLYKRILALDPANGEALFLGGTALFQAKRWAQSVALLERAVAVQPDLAEAHNNLGLARFELALFDGAEDAYGQAIALAPDFAPAHNNLGEMLRKLGRLEEARDCLRRAVAIQDDFAEAHNNLGSTLGALGQGAEAVAAFRRAIQLAPAYGDAHANLCALLLERGEAEAALDACKDYLAVAPGHSGAIAFETTAWAGRKAWDRVRYLVDIDRLLHRARPAPPEGLSSEAFNRALARHAADHPSLVYEPADRATRKGWHTKDLTKGPKGPVAGLEAMIRRAVGAYLAALPTDLAHPFLGQKPPADLDITVWAVVMEAEGHVVPHIHATAWISGVYYAEVPESVRRAGDGHEGWIEFGRVPDLFPLDEAPEILAIRPEEGLMVIFPSYIYHGTVPMKAPERRISYAFDVRRAPGRGGGRR